MDSDSEPSRHLLLVRHAATASTLAGTFGGPSDTPLDDTGKKQASALAPSFATFAPDLLLSSPALRCRQTADFFPPTKMEILHDLKERDFGSWEGKTFSSIASSHPEELQAFYRFLALPDFAPPSEKNDAETNANFLLRTSLLAEKIRSNPSSRTAVVSHGGTLRSLLCHLLALDHEKYFFLFDLPPAASAELVLYSGGASLLRLSPPPLP